MFAEGERRVSVSESKAFGFVQVNVMSLSVETELMLCGHWSGARTVTVTVFWAVEPSAPVQVRERSAVEITETGKLPLTLRAPDQVGAEPESTEAVHEAAFEVVHVTCV
jgi:hypothetical protein